MNRGTSDLRKFLSDVRPALLVLTTVLFIGTVSFYLLWRGLGGSWLDAFYMTLITVTTVGYAEVYPLGTPGRYLAMGISLAGIGSLFYLLIGVMEYLVLRRLQDPFRRRAMQRRIDNLSGHVIVAGFGRMGQRAAEELAEDRVEFVIIDRDPVTAEACYRAGYLFLTGDAEEDAVLTGAGVKRASGLIVATDGDATNAFIIMSARALNPNLTIVSRAEEASAVPKLLRAGADRAIDLYALSGRRLANTVVRPAAIDFFTGLRQRRELGIQEIDLPPNCPLAGKSLRALELRSVTGASVIAVLRGDHYVANPGPEFALEVGDQLITLGNLEQFEALRKLAQP